MRTSVRPFRKVRGEEVFVRFEWLAAERELFYLFSLSPGPVLYPDE